MEIPRFEFQFCGSEQLCVEPETVALEEARLSDRGSGAPYKTPEGYLFPYGDYFGIAADRMGRNYVIWGEGTGRGTGGGSWFTRGG